MAQGARAGDRSELLLRSWALERSGDVLAWRSFLEQLPEGALVDEPELGVSLIAAYVSTHRAADARRIEALLAPAMLLRENDRVHRRYVNFGGVLLTRAGELAAADGRLREAEWMATSAGDEVVRLFVLQNRAVVADIRCDYAESLTLNARALTLSRSLGRSASEGHIHHHLGMTYRQLGLFAESRRHFERVGRGPYSIGSTAAMAQERAILLHLSGEEGLAESLARRALAMQREAESASGTADALRVLAMVLSGRGDLAGAQALLDSARETVPGDDPMTRGEIFEELAVVRLMGGNTIGSAEAEATAAAIYSGMEAPRRAERMRVRLAMIELDAGL